ncbi:MAG: hypothetical protein AAFV88_06380 [Planctomycetota bacterium]
MTTEQQNQDSDHLATEGMSADDVALMFVSGYLRRCGIQHPDILRDLSHLSVARGKQLQKLTNGNEKCDQELLERSLEAAIDQVRGFHDQWSEEFWAGDGEQCQDGKQCCIVSLSRVLGDPAIMRPRDQLPTRMMVQLHSRTNVVIPAATPKPMRPNRTPRLIGPLRHRWWLQLACSALAVFGLGRFMSAGEAVGSSQSCIH